MTQSTEAEIPPEKQNKEPATWLESKWKISGKKTKEYTEEVRGTFFQRDLKTIFCGKMGQNSTWTMHVSSFSIQENLEASLPALNDTNLFWILCMDGLLRRNWCVQSSFHPLCIYTMWLKNNRQLGLLYSTTRKSKRKLKFAYLSSHLRPSSSGLWPRDSLLEASEPFE